MIENIIRFSINNKLIIGLFVLAMIGWGFYSIKHIPLDAVPDITDNQVQIITTSPTLATQEVEKFITYPLEIAMGNIPNVEEIRSVSRFGLSVITVVFEEDTDIYRARQLISERIKAAEGDIPEGLGEPEMGPITTGLGEIYQYVIYPEKGYEDQYSPHDLRTIQDWIVKRQLTGIKGVIEVNSIGGFLKQYEVAFKPDKLRSLNVSLEEIFEAIQQNNANTGGSYIEKTPYTYFIRGEGLLKTIKEIGEVVIKVQDGIPILVKDVAKVTIGHAPRFGAVTMNGLGEVAAGQVMMLKGENSAEVTERVKERIEQIEKSLPEGIVMEAYLDRTKLVNQTTKTVMTNLIEGGLIVIFVLVLLLGNFRAGLVVASVIPLSMLFAVSMMKIFGVSANLMSLGAIDFGLIVDGAVIIVEAIIHRLNLNYAGQKLNQEQMNTAVFDSSSKIRKSAAFGEIIILIVYLPILFLTGIEGKMFRPMAQTVSFAILGALILSLTYVPMMSSLFLNKNITAKRTIADRIIDAIRKLYDPVLQLSLRIKGVVLLLTVGLFILSIWQFRQMGGEFIPTLEEGDFALHQILPPGSSIQQGVDVSAELQNILLDNFPEVEKVVTKIGTAEIPTDIMPMEAGDIYVILKPKEEWTSGKTKEELFEKMEEEMNKFPGVIYEFTQPIQMRFNELMTGIRQDIAIKIFGEDTGLLFKKANEVKAIIENIPDVADIQVEPVSGLQQIVIEYDRSKMAKYGLNSETINRVIKMGFAGEKAGAIFEGEKSFDLVIRLDESLRNDPEQVAKIYIPLPNGGQIPLNEVADIGFQEGPTQISREDTKRRITIGVNTRGRDVAGLVAEIESVLDEQLELPAGYYVTYGGQFENLEKANARLRIAVPAALALIFILLYLTFGSTRQALLIFTAIPMSAIGGIWALNLRAMPFSISAGVGFIALFGVAVLNGIVLIAYFNQLKKEGMTNIYERIIKGTSVRLRPVIMTAAVASLGFLPMAVSNSAGAEVQQPLATVVIGGLITATFLTLIVLPVLYYFSEKQWKASSKALIFLPLFFIGQTGAAQTSLTLDEAVEIAYQNHPQIRQSNLKIEQQGFLANTGGQKNLTNFFVTGEEFDANNQGIQSLGFSQVLNLPKVARVTKAYYEKGQLLTNQEIVLTKAQLRRDLAQAYYTAIYHRQKQDILDTLIQLTNQFVQTAQIRFEAGETGKLPLLTATGIESNAQLENIQNSSDISIAEVKFNNLLYSDQQYTIDSDKLPLPGLVPEQRQMHPRLQYQQLAINMAQSKLEMDKSKLLPQLNTGLRTQIVNGNFPFWGYQVGLNVPLFKKAYKSQIQASEIAVQIEEANLSNSRKTLEQDQALVFAQLQKEQEQFDYINRELLPISKEQEALSWEAYQNGEIDYLAYIQNLNYFFQVQQQWLDTQYRYQLLIIEMEYLSGF
jgi:cobalt-zinc-cadmium resistance protein CzcA